ncbi:MAG: TMEM175 family protein [Burkholderiaceae bacterium]
MLPLWPMFMSYVLSFVYVGIYWNKPQYASHPHIASPHSLFCFAYLQ